MEDSEAGPFYGSIGRRVKIGNAFDCGERDLPMPVIVTDRADVRNYSVAVCYHWG